MTAPTDRTAEPGLFDLDGPTPAVVSHERTVEARRRARQYNALIGGSHPLSLAVGRHISLHADAAPPDDRKAEGLRCGTCRWRALLGHHNRTYAKCVIDPKRLTHGAATDVRAWWPACVDYEEAS